MIVPDINYPIIVIACCFMVLDILTGFVQACVNKNVESQKMKNGLLHKCGFLLAILFGILCEYSMQYIDLGFTMPIQEAVCGFICCIEIISVLENLAKISPELAGSKFMSIFKRNDEMKVDNVDVSGLDVFVMSEETNDY